MAGRILLIAALLLALRCAAAAQDRPLLESFRIGYPHTESIAERMRAAGTLDQALRRKGFVVVWQEFDSGVAAVRALHAEKVDLALNVSLPDVVTAKRENLTMVFVAELRSIAPTCCDLEELFADHMFKRYTLSSEYFADRREDVLLVMHQEMIRVVQRGPDHLVSRHQNLGPIPVALVDQRRPETQAHVGPVTRSAMEEVKAATITPPSDEASAATIDLADINYWLPQ